MRAGSFLAAALIMGAISAGMCPSGAHAASHKVRDTGLSDVSFGLIAGTADRSISQSICAYSTSSTAGYSVTATGSGPAGGFSLAGGPAPLPYEVLWAGAANQTGGTTLIAGTGTSGFTSAASQQTCNSGTNSSASLTIIIRSTTLSSAAAGTYAGTLQITIAPE
jgi:hypothetical protein